MTDTVIATRSTITIGPLSVDGFMLPDGSYRMSLSQAADAVGLKPRNAFDFLQSKGIKQLLGKGYTDSVSNVEIASDDQTRGQSRIRGLPLEVVTAYWIWQTFRGNKKAIALVMALATETLERRFDNVFGVEKSEDDYNAMLFKRVESLETDVGESYAICNDVARENEELWFYIREQGLPGPYKVEDGTDEHHTSTTTSHPNELGTLRRPRLQPCSYSLGPLPLLKERSDRSGWRSPPER